MFGWISSNRVPASVDISPNRRLLGLTSLLANSVYDDDDDLVGKLEEIVIDAQTGCVRHVVLAVGGILGIGRRRIAVPWSALNPDADLRRCVVDTTQMQLTAVQVPDNDPWLQRDYAAPARERFSR